MIRRLFAALYDTVGKGSEDAGMREERRKLLSMRFAIKKQKSRFTRVKNLKDEFLENVSIFRVRLCLPQILPARM